MKKEAGSKRRWDKKAATVGSGIIIIASLLAKFSEANFSKSSQKIRFAPPDRMLGFGPALLPIDLFSLQLNINVL